jgi:hypothetical protein
MADKMKRGTVLSGLSVACAQHLKPPVSRYSAALAQRRELSQRYLFQQRSLLRWVRKLAARHVSNVLWHAQFEEVVMNACRDYQSMAFDDFGATKPKASYSVSNKTLPARLIAVRKNSTQIAKLLAEPLTNKRARADLAGCRRRLLDCVAPVNPSAELDRAFTIDDLENGRGDDIIINALMMDRTTDEPLLVAHMRSLVEGSKPEAAISAAAWIVAHAKIALERHRRVHRILTIPGNSGDSALEAWISDMLTIWEKFLGREIATSVASPGDKREGKAGGPLIRFLRDFGDILGIELSPDAWRRHIRDALAIRESKNI